MGRRLTREITYVRLPESRIREINDLVSAWPQETKAFMRARLNQYRPPMGLFNNLLETVLSLFMDAPEKRFNVLKDPNILTDWQKRFEISGHTNPQEAWNKILEKEVSAKDYRYLLSLLDKELLDVHIPVELHEMFEKVYRAHLRKEYISDTSVPKASLLLFVGPSGSGKSTFMNLIGCLDRATRGEYRLEGIPVGDMNEIELRSEERRVGKECRSRWSPYH